MHPLAPAAVTAATPLSCPDCAAPLPPAAAACPACELPLRGPLAARLWAVDTELADLGARTTALLAERAHLLRLLRRSPRESAPPTAPRPEWGLRRVQGTLLGAGALLLTVAAVVFAAVTYDDLGLVGQALVLLTLTAGAGAGVHVLLRRGLSGTAEAVAAVTLALALLDAYATRRAGLAGTDEVDSRAYWAGATALLALAAAGAATRLPGLRLPGLAAVALAQAPVLAVVTGTGPAAAAWLLTGQAGLDVLALAALRRRATGDAEGVLPERVLPQRALGAAALALGGLAALVAAAELLEAAALAVGPGRSSVPHALALVALAALALAAAPLARTRRRRECVAALPVLLTAAAAAGLALPGWHPARVALALAAVGAASAVVAAVAARAEARGADRARGPLAAACLVVATAVALVGPKVALAVTGPLAWPLEAWSLQPVASARAAASPVAAWTGGLAITGVLALAAAALLAPAALGATALAGRGAGRNPAAVPAALPAATLAATLGGALAWAAAVALPVALDLSFPAALAVLVALAAALLGLGSISRARFPADALLAAGAAALVLASSWATASQVASLVVLPLAAGLLGVAGLTPSRARAGLLLLAGLATGAAVTALALSLGAPAERAGFLLLAVPAGLLALASRPGLGRDRTLAAEAAAVALGGAAFALASADTGWLAWTLGAAGLLGLATALRRDRRRVAYTGGLLLAASSWVRLAEAGIGAPEPYVAPVAFVALVLGHLRRRHEPRTSSRQAYAAGLAGLLLPSLAAALDDPGAARPLLLGAVALGVTLVGARSRLAAPLVAGTGVLTVLALQQLAPLAEALPRWTALASAGAVLIAVGATYEQRRRDLARLREAYRALG